MKMHLVHGFLMWSKIIMLLPNQIRRNDVCGQQNIQYEKPLKHLILMAAYNMALELTSSLRLLERLAVTSTVCMEHAVPKLPTSV